MSRKEQYLKTGEFAKLCNVNKHTLFHYCEIGLFTPKYIDENGYRYYNVLQYDTFLTIRQLSTLGMPLAEIKEYLKGRNPEGLVKLYKKQEELLNKKIEELKMIKKSVYNQRTNIEEALKNNEKFFVEDLKKVGIRLSKSITVMDDKKMTYEFGKLIKESKNNISQNIFGMCQSLESIKEEKIEFQFYVQDEFEKNIARPNGKYLSMFHRGSYETLYKSFNEIIDYAKKNKISLEKYVYAETIVGDWAVMDSSEYIIKILIQIEG